MLLDAVECQIALCSMRLKVAVSLVNVYLRIVLDFGLRLLRLMRHIVAVVRHLRMQYAFSLCTYNWFLGCVILNMCFFFSVTISVSRWFLFHSFVCMRIVYVTIPNEFKNIVTIYLSLFDIYNVIFWISQWKFVYFYSRTLTIFWIKFVSF